MPRALRFIFWERRRKKCRLPEGLARTLPDPVRRKRFLALDLVFILGIFCPPSFEVQFDVAGHALFSLTTRKRAGYSSPSVSLQAMSTCF